MSDANAGILFVFGIAALIAVIIVALIWQIFRTAQTKTATEATFAQEEAYRTLAEQAVAAQRTIAEEQRTIAAEMAELRTRVAAMEKLLREVG